MDDSTQSGRSEEDPPVEPAIHSNNSMTFERLPNPIQINRAVALVKKHMEQQYIRAGWGWSNSSKRKELCHRDARWLLIEEKSQLQAFANYRIEVEDDDTSILVYIYELQVDEAFQGRGIGSDLLDELLRDARQVWCFLYDLLGLIHRNLGLGERQECDADVLQTESCCFRVLPAQRICHRSL